MGLFLINFIAVLLCSLLTISNNGFANDTTITKVPEDKFPRRYLGVSASTLSAFGVSVHNISKSEGSAFKLNFCISPDFSTSKTWVFIGGEYQIKIYKNSFSRLYGLCGIGYWTDILTFGPGIGYELFSGKPGIAINIDLGFGFLKSLEFPERDIKLIPGIGLGLSYAY